MMMVRAAIAADAVRISKLNQLVQRIHHEALPRLFKPSNMSWPPEILRTVIEDPNRIVGLAEADDVLLGYVSAHVQAHSESDIRYADSCLYVDHLVVRKDARRQGIGTALLNFVEGRAAAFGLASIGVDYWAFNQEARLFFERRGFEALNIKMTKPLKLGILPS